MELAQASPEVAPSAEPVTAESMDGDADRTITLEELKAMNLDYQTHCMEASPGEKPNLYFVWKHGGTRVAVWGSFNNWSRAIPLFYDGSTEMFVAFTECEDVQEGETCIFKFSVDDEWKVDPELEIITDDEDGSQYNALLICSQYYQGSQVEATYEPVRYKVLPRLMRTTSVEYVLDSDDLGSAVNDARIQDSIEILESERNLQKLRMQFSSMENASMTSTQVEEVQVSLQELVDVPLSESVTETAPNDDDSYDVVTAPSEVQSVDGSIEPTESATSSRGELVDVLDPVPEIVEDKNAPSSYTIDRLPPEIVSEIRMFAENTAAVKLQDSDAMDWEEVSTTENLVVPADPIAELENIIATQEQLMEQALRLNDSDNVEALMMELILNLEETIDSQEKVVDLLVSQKSDQVMSNLTAFPVELYEETKSAAEASESVRLQSLDADKFVVTERGLEVPNDEPFEVEEPVQSEHQSSELIREARLSAESNEALRLQALDAEQLDLVVSPFELPEQEAPSPALQAFEEHEENSREVEVEEPTPYVLPDVVRESIRIAVEAEYEQELLTELIESLDLEVQIAFLPEDLRDSIRLQAEHDLVLDLQETEIFARTIVEEVIENSMTWSEEPDHELLVKSDDTLQTQVEDIVQTVGTERSLVVQEPIEDRVVLESEESLIQRIAEEVVNEMVDRSVQLSAEIKQTILSDAEDSFAVELQQADYVLETQNDREVTLAATPEVAVEIIEQYNQESDDAKEVHEFTEIVDESEDLIDLTRSIPTDTMHVTKTDSAVESLLDEIIEEMTQLPNDDPSTTPRLLQVEIPEIAFEAPLTPSETNEDTPAPPSPVRTPSEREILILTPDSAEIIPIPSHLLSPQAGVFEELLERHTEGEIEHHDGIFDSF
jgi:hypothetical protein